MTSDRPRLDRRVLFASGAAAALLAATGVSAQTAPVRGGRLRMALSGGLRTDSFDARNAMGLFMQMAMVGAAFETLTEIAADGTLRGELARTWQGSPNAQHWIFNLRKDVAFHNGKPFGADDVIASFQLHAAGVLSDIQQIEALNNHQVQITLSVPDADFPYRLSDPQMVIYPAGQITEAMAHGIGTGLYRTRRFLAGRQFVGDRVAEHYKDGQAGWFDQIELVSLPADSVRAEALRDHFVDAADLTDAADLGTLNRVVLLPEGNFMTSAVRKDISLPRGVGRRWPLDNLRAAQRWWMA